MKRVFHIRWTQPAQRRCAAALVGLVIAVGMLPAAYAWGANFRSQFVLVEPRNVPAGSTVPVVIYLHGAGAATLGSPQACDAMLQRLAADGYLVIAPWYIEDNLLRPHTWQASAAEGISAGLAEARRRGRFCPDASRVAIVGESLGGLFALRIAHLARTRPELPVPRAVILHDGAGYGFAPYYAHRIRDVRRWKYTTAAYDDFSGIGEETELVALVAEETWREEIEVESRDGDAIVYGNANAGGVISRAWHRTRILPHRKHALLVHGDHGRHPPLRADHGVPTEPADAIDCTFWAATRTALAAMAAGRSPDFSRDLEQRWDNGCPRLTVLPEPPPPQPFRWDCENILEAAPIARLFLPRGACR